MHTMTRAAAEIGGYYVDQFTYENKFLVNETRQLTVEQVADDVETTTNHRDRVGRIWVGHADDDPDDGYMIEHAESLWRRWAPEQVALEAGLAVYLNRLTDKQRDALRLMFWGRLSYAQVGAVFGLTKAGAQRRIDPALASLRRALLEAFVAEQEAA